MRIKAIKYIAIFFIIGCSPKTETKDNIFNTSTTDTAILTLETTPPIIKKTFDYIKFKSLADSLISKIADEKIALQLTIDTIEKSLSEYSYYTPLINNEFPLLKYNFYPGKKRSLLRFSIIQAKYSDTLSLNKAFIKLKEDASDIYSNDESDYHNIPGLTYTNDYVIVVDKEILWLNLPCPYSNKNVKRVKQIFSHSLSIDNLKDSINCSCGQSNCLIK